MAPRKQFVHLTATHPLVKELKSGKHEWWNTLVERSHKDPEINIQVRGDYLSVYNRMGSLLEIRLKNKKVVCRTHYKYLIASRRKEEEYVDVNPSGKDLTVDLKSCDLVTSILEKENFDRIKSNIARLTGEEKSIQSKLVEKNRNTLLDVEIAFSESGTLIDPEEDDASSSRKTRSRSTRIDLVNYDKNLNALVFIELKQIFDGRLYSDSKGRKEVNKQIEKYKLFAKNHAEELIKTYNDVIEVKKRAWAASQRLRSLVRQNRERRTETHPRHRQLQAGHYQCQEGQSGGGPRHRQSRRAVLLRSPHRPHPAPKEGQEQGALSQRLAALISTTGEIMGKCKYCNSTGNGACANS